MSLPSWNTARFGKPIASILGAGDRLPELAPKTGDESARIKLDKLAGEKAAPPQVMAGLYLYFDLLDPSHKIAQEIESPSGSYWHGMMHRREPDDDNSAYWFRRVGEHPSLAAFSPQARKHLQDSGQAALAKELYKGQSWDPFAFIKACSAARRDGKPERVRLLNELQLLEWRCLFDYCFDQPLS